MSEEAPRCCEDLAAVRANCVQLTSAAALALDTLRTSTGRHKRELASTAILYYADHGAPPWPP